MISSKSNAKIKNVRKLLSSAKERRLKGVFVVEGLRLVREADPEQVTELYVSESLAASGEIDLSKYPNAEIVTGEVFRSLSDTVSPQGVLAVVKQPVWKWDLSAYSEKCRLLLLDDIQDPGNLGTMIRTAEAAGTDMVIMSEGCADIYNPKVIRSTMGSIFRVPHMVADLVPLIEELKIEGILVYGAALENSVNYETITPPERTAIVIGNEGNGISEPVLNAVSRRIKIPMKGKVESLNAAVSAAILLYHFN